MTVDLGGIRLPNPILLASGTCGYGRELASFYDLRRLGGIITKGTTLHPRPGNPPPRITETPAGMLNSIGLENPGVEKVVEEEIPFLRQFAIPVMVNIAGETVADYARLASILDGVPGVSGLEVNVSCPNVKGGGMAFGVDPEATAAVVRAVRRETSLPVIAKLSPNVSDIVAVARAARRAGADALSLINTLVGMVIDVHTRRPLLGAVTGGLSGPAIRPVAVRMVWEVAAAVDAPILGVGGITCGEDAVQFLLAGATAVAVGSMGLVDPLSPLRILGELQAYMRQEGFACVDDLVGLAHDRRRRSSW